MVGEKERGYYKTKKREKEKRACKEGKFLCRENYTRPSVQDTSITFIRFLFSFVIIFSQRNHFLVTQKFTAVFWGNGF